MSLKLTRLSKRFYSFTSNQNLIENLSKSKISNFLGDVDEILRVAPELNKFSADQWEKSLTTLRSLGFNAKKFPHMITHHPPLLSKSKDTLATAINNWSFFDFGEKPTYQLLERYPELIEVKNFQLVNENLNIVKSFVGQKHGYKVIRNCPNIISDNTEKLEEKVDYLRDVMKVDPVEAYKSDVFSLDIMTIKTRHVFLERLGLYFKKKKRGDDNDAHEVKKNPKLSKITDSSDKRFATKICHVTLEEYETFIEMYKEEVEMEEDRRDRFKNRNAREFDDDDEDDDEDEDEEKDFRSK